MYKREIECACKRDIECMCVREKERDSVCVSVCVQERESEMGLLVCSSLFLSFITDRASVCFLVGSELLFCVECCNTFNDNNNNTSERHNVLPINKNILL